MPKIAVISDVHSNFLALQAVLGEIKKIQPDLLINLGDTIGYGPHPQKCLKALDKLKIKQETIAGNHEESLLMLAVNQEAVKSIINPRAAEALSYSREKISQRAIRKISNLPIAKFLEDLSIGMAHGSYARQSAHNYVFFPDDVKKELEDDPQIILLGHTHKPAFYSDGGDEALWQKDTRDERIITFDSNEKIVANPGSVGQPRDLNPQASFGVLEIENGNGSFQVRRISYNIAAAQKDMKKVGLPDFLAERLSEGR